MKKVLSLVLVIAMVLSSMSFAFAGTFSDTADSDYEKAIETLAALGVLSGYPDGTFGPGRTITRAELAKVLVEALGYGELVAGASNVFPDTADHWAKGYIAIASGTGLVLGYPDGTFRPENPVTFDETYTMVIRALGYTDSVLSGNWPTNYKVKAIDLDLNDDVVMAKAQADRGAVAQIFYNTLEKAMVEIDEDGIAVDTGKDFIDNIATPDKSFDVTPETADPDHKKFAGEIVDLTPYMYQNLSVYLNDDDQVVYVKGSNNLVLEGILNDEEDVTADELVVEDADEEDNTFDIVVSADDLDFVTEYMVNGVETDIANLAFEGADIKVTVVLDAEDDDKLVDGLDVIGVVAVKATDEVQVTSEYKTGRTRISGIELPLDKDDEVDLTKVTVEGVVDSLEDIAEDSIVTVYEGLDASDELDKIRLVVATDTVEGKITKVNYNGTVVTIDGKNYDASAFYDDDSAVVGETGTLYLNADGEFFTFDSEEEKDTVYGVVIGASNGEYDSFLDDYEKYAKVKIATADDEEVVYSVAHKAEIFGDSSVADEDVDNFTDLFDVVPVVVEYELDEDGYVDYMKEVNFDEEGEDFDTESKAFILADNVVIFDGEDDPYQVLTVDQLADDIVADVVYNEDGELELIVVTEGAEAEAAGTFAIINNVEKAVDENNDTVYLITAYVDGKKVSYYTDEDFYKLNTTTSEVRAALRGGYKFNEFTMDGDVITDVTTEGAFGADVVLEEGNVKSVKVDNDVITLADGTVIVLADEAIVYLQTDTAVVELAEIADIDADSAATVAETEGDAIKALDTDDDGEFDIVIIKER